MLRLGNGRQGNQAGKYVRIAARIPIMTVMDAVSREGWMAISESSPSELGFAVNSVLRRAEAEELQAFQRHKARPGP